MGPPGSGNRDSCLRIREGYSKLPVSSLLQKDDERSVRFTYSLCFRENERKCEADAHLRVCIDAPASGRVRDGIRRGASVSRTRARDGIRTTVRATSFPASNPRTRRSTRPFVADARDGIRTHGPLRERVLSPPPLARLGHPRSTLTPGGPRKSVSVRSGDRPVPASCGRTLNSLAVHPDYVRIPGLHINDR